ncbi:MAG TPA: hydrogenase nickel incorporation protein HypB [Spirochaetota bacterium]
MSRTIEIKEAIYSENDKHAEKVHTSLAERGIYTVNILGSAGAGKTSTLINLIKRIKAKSYVIEGDIESDIDTRTMRSLGVEAFQINTGGNCHLNAPMIESIIPQMSLNEKGVLFIENIGNLVCPAEFVIGEDVKILIASVPEGSDKPYKYPLVFQRAGAIIVNKKDLLPYIPFDIEFFEKGVRALNHDAPIFYTSCATGEGFDELAAWFNQFIDSHK